jgi:Fe2+ or Zn2+ uptake regulation protein
VPHDEIAVAKLLQSRGLRVTGQRLAILDAICEGRGHMTLGEILASVERADPSIDPSTVHRTVDLLCELGVVAASLGRTGETVYEIVGDPPHHHLICDVCGKEREVPDAAIAALLDPLRRDYGFVVADSHLILRGTCVGCAGKDRR